jgi:hypothetical protein
LPQSRRDIAHGLDGCSLKHRHQHADELAMNTSELVEQLAQIGVKCLHSESLTGVKTAAENYRRATEVLEATVAVMESAGKLSELPQLQAKAELLQQLTQTAEVALDTSKHYLEHVTAA